MNRKYLLFGAIGLLILIIGLVALAATSGGGRKAAQTDTGDVTLTYWGVDDSSEALDPFFQQFQKENGKVKIEYKKLERASYEQQLLDALAAGKGPDLFEIHDTWLPRYYDKITPIPEEQYKTEDYRRDFFKSVSDGTVVDNRIYGIPFYLDTLGLFYNDTLINESDLGDPPRTWQELVGTEGTPIAQTQLGQLTSRQGNTINRSAIAIGKGNVPRSADILALLMLQNKTEMVNAERDKALFNLPQKVEGKDIKLGTESLKFYTCFGDPRCKHYTWSGSEDPLKAFAAGKVAMLVGYPYTKQQVAKLNPDLRVGVAKVPQLATGDPVNYASYWPHVVSKTSSHQDAAWKFIRFMTDKEQVRAYQEETQRVSPRKDVTGSGENTAFYEQNESSTTWYKGDAARADQVFVDMIGRVLAGEDPQRAIDAGANTETGILVDVKQRFARP